MSVSVCNVISKTSHGKQRMSVCKKRRSSWFRWLRVGTSVFQLLHFEQRVDLSRVYGKSPVLKQARLFVVLQDGHMQRTYNPVSLDSFLSFLKPDFFFICLLRSTTTNEVEERREGLELGRSRRPRRKDLERKGKERSVSVVW